MTGAIPALAKTRGHTGPAPTRPRGGRGIYSSHNWEEALSYASPYAKLEGGHCPEITAQIVLLVRIPGSLDQVGVDTWMDKVIEERKGNIEERSVRWGLSGGCCPKRGSSGLSRLRSSVGPTRCLARVAPARDYSLARVAPAKKSFPSQGGLIANCVQVHVPSQSGSGKGLFPSQGGSGKEIFP